MSETPLKRGDCGRLCKKSCCGGTDRECVFAYPGEAELLKDCGYKLIPAENNRGCPAVLCGGSCERKNRPLGCMLFPLFPFAYEQGGEVRIKVIFDPRGAGICPLYAHEEMLSRSFVRAVKRAGLVMLGDERLREYLLSLSDELGDIIALSDRLLK